MPIFNPSFDDEGVEPGLAAHWTLATSVAHQRIAGFGPEPFEAQESFERWAARQVDFLPGELARAFFAALQAELDPHAEGYEAFEKAWSNSTYLTTLPSGQALPATFGDGPIEDLETGWRTVPFARAWNTVVAAAAIFDGEMREDFEETWRGNQSFAWQWGAVDSQQARFDAGTTPEEDFEHGWTNDRYGV